MEIIWRGYRFQLDEVIGNERALWLNLVLQPGPKCSRDSRVPLDYPVRDRGPVQMCERFLTGRAYARRENSDEHSFNAVIAHDCDHQFFHRVFVPNGIL
jgi:hypothetical protein